MFSQIKTLHYHFQILNQNQTLSSSPTSSTQSVSLKKQLSKLQNDFILFYPLIHSIGFQICDTCVCVHSIFEVLMGLFQTCFDWSLNMKWASLAFEILLTGHFLPFHFFNLPHFVPLLFPSSLCAIFFFFFYELEMFENMIIFY